MDLNVLVVGGGIHGVGLLHDLATRKIEGIHLVEQAQLASGTSSRTTKLVHGGLRYLEHPAQWALVREALRERALLLRNLPGLVSPLRFVLPNFKGGRPTWLVRLGLALYDQLAWEGGLPKTRRLTKAEVTQLAPYLRRERLEQEVGSGFLYYDAQMLDDVIVRVAAQAAIRLGATYAEHTRVEEVAPDGEGFRIRLSSPQGGQVMRSRVVVNATGAWANANLLKWAVSPRVPCLLNVGSHLLFTREAVDAQPEDCAATLLQHDDGRVLFFIPWQGSWLLGTTESMLKGTPDKWECPLGDREYLLLVATRNLNLIEPARHTKEFFCGIRTIPHPKRGVRLRDRSVPDAWRDQPFASPWYLRKVDRDISSLSREAVVDEVARNLFTIYGGKFTTYRALCEQVGDRVATRLRCSSPSGTRLKGNWFLDELKQARPELFHSDRSLRQQ
ncbi:MAG: glycerol-3-phosphate dehydrogenase/oxidase [Nitrospiraceae bacterium]